MVSLQSPKHQENKYKFPFNVILRIPKEFFCVRKCYLCNNNCNIFFNWSSSRNINIWMLMGLLEILNDIPELDGYGIVKNGFPICFKCCNKFNLHI